MLTFVCACLYIQNILVGWNTEESWFYSRQRDEILSSQVGSYPAWGPICSLFIGYRSTALHVVPRLSISKAIPRIPFMPLWYAHSFAFAVIMDIRIYPLVANPKRVLYSFDVSAVLLGRIKRLHSDILLKSLLLVRGTMTVLPRLCSLILFYDVENRKYTKAIPDI